MQDSRKQITRYLVVGVLTNSSGYATYILLTWLGVNPKVAMSAIYFVAAFLGYWGNRMYTFSFSGGIALSTVRYALAHVLGYGLNLFLLLYLINEIFENSIINTKRLIR